MMELSLQSRGKKSAEEVESRLRRVTRLQRFCQPDSLTAVMAAGVADAGRGP